MMVFKERGLELGFLSQPADTVPWDLSIQG